MLATVAPAKATGGTKLISAKALSDHECNSSEWHFVITQIDNIGHAPGSISVQWANGNVQTVGRTAFTGGTAHYATTANLSSTVTSATTTIYSSWSGQFNLSHGPCGAPPPTTPPPTTPPPTTPPPVTTEPPPVTTEPPPVTTEPPPVTTEPPPVTTEPPPVTTQPPPTTVVPPTNPPTVTAPPPPWQDHWVGLCKQWGIASGPYYFTYADGTAYGSNPWGTSGEIWFGGLLTEVKDQSFVLYVNGKAVDHFTVVDVGGGHAWCKGTSSAAQPVPATGSNEIPPATDPDYTPFAVVTGSVGLIVFAILAWAFLRPRKTVA